MNTILKDIEDIHVIGQEIRANNENIDLIEKFWKKFLEKKIVNSIQNQVNYGTIIAVYTNYNSDEKGDYSLILGAPVYSLDRIPSGMIGLTIPKGTYATIPAHGSIPESTMAAWEYIWSSEFPYKRAYLYDFELYEPEKMAKETPEVDVYISIKQ